MQLRLIQEMLKSSTEISNFTLSIMVKILGRQQKTMSSSKLFTADRTPRKTSKHLGPDDVVMPLIDCSPRKTVGSLRLRPALRMWGKRKQLEKAFAEVRTYSKVPEILVAGWFLKWSMVMGMVTDTLLETDSA